MINKSEQNATKNVFLKDYHFNEIIINSLPGIFYIYEPFENYFRLFAWNKNFETTLGYTAKELWHKPANDFFSKAEYKRVAKAIEQVFLRGNNNIIANLRTKSGKAIPYLFEGYSFEHKNKPCFMGVGLDISTQYKLQRSLIRSEKVKQKSVEELQKKERELIVTALELSETSEAFNLVNKNIENLLNKDEKTITKEELKNLQISLKSNFKNKDNWELFKTHFIQIHNNFFTNLLKAHPELTRTEIKLCAYLRINMSSHQISSILNISNEGIKKSRYRIRKKLGLKHGNSLEDYICKF